MTAREPAIYADPSTVQCPRCDALPGQPCINLLDGNPREHWHVSRERMPMLYACRVCGGPFAVSLATGAKVHVGKIDATHSAQPWPDNRRWRNR